MTTGINITLELEIAPGRQSDFAKIFTDLCRRQVVKGGQLNTSLLEAWVANLFNGTATLKNNDDILYR